jgi:hypothetical protein
MSSKLLIAVAALALISTAQTVGAPVGARTPDAAGVAQLLHQAGDTVRVTRATCEHRPSSLFGPNVYRCAVEGERSALSETVQMTVTLVAHDGGWVIVGR